MGVAVRAHRSEFANSGRVPTLFADGGSDGLECATFGVTADKIYFSTTGCGLKSVHNSPLAPQGKSGLSGPSAGSPEVAKHRSAAAPGTLCPIRLRRGRGPRVFRS